MPFQYTIESPLKIRFTRLKGGCGRAAFIIIGAIFTLVGAGLIAFGDGIEMPFGLIRFIVPIFGIGAIYVGIIYPQVLSKTTPDEIIFDNENGRVQINQKASDIKTAFIYYDEIEDFIMKTKKQETSSSSNTTTTSRTRYTYHVYLSKADGGQWELLKFGNQDAALLEIEKLKKLINLTQKPQRITETVQQSKKFNLVSDYAYSELSWRNPLGFGPLVLFLFSGLFITIGYIITSSGFIGEDFPVFGYFVAGFIGLVFLFVVIGNAVKMIKNAFTNYAVKVSSDTLEYIERDNAARVKKSVLFLAQDIHAISFTFDTDETLRKIFIYTHQQFIEQKSMKPSFSLTYIKTMYQFYSSLLSLDLQDLTAVEALYIENFLQQQLRDRAHVKIA